MYPKKFIEDTTSNAEKKVFEYLRDNAPDDWQVIHSFRIPKHNSFVFGECDFIVFVPNLGIAFLEIKGGRVGVNEKGEWLFTNKNNKTTIKPQYHSPFEQARQGMFNISEIISNKINSDYNWSKYLFTYGVIFTDEAYFPVDSLTEDEPWRLLQNNKKYDYVTFIKKLLTNQIAEYEELGKKARYPVSADMAKEIVTKLRPTITCVAPIRNALQDSEESIISLTDGQLECLDDIEINDHIVVIGGAGTGKTVIALEDARRAKMQGLNVCVICFNSNLNKTIRSNLKNTGIDAYTLHGLMKKIVNNSNDDSQSNIDEYFTHKLPMDATEALKTTGPLYDKIIVDEFQDICIKPYLDFLDALVTNGLTSGVFSFYADFARQAIYNEKVSLSILDDYAFYSKKKLNINCRNTMYIGNEMINITGFSDASYKLKITGEPVEYISYDSVDDEKNKFRDCLKQLMKLGLSPEDIIVLASNKRDKTVLQEADPNAVAVGNYGDDPSGCFALFSTIQSYKGLESKIVILIDIDNYDDSKMMYVAFSRARSKLFVFESLSAAKQRKDLTIRR